MVELWVIGSSLFILAATCYLLFLTSDPLEDIGGRLGKLLHVPEDVIAATFQALATSGPEIVMAILAATAFVGAGWFNLQMGEKACSGCLNMCFSAMDNLLGIGCLGIIFMIIRGTVKKDEVIDVAPSVKVGLIFYILASTCLCLFIIDGGISPVEGWVLMVIGITFIISQFFVPPWLRRIEKIRADGSDTDEPDDDNGEEDDGEDDEDEAALPSTVGGWIKDFLGHGFLYAFLVFGLVVFVRECLGATFTMATIGIVSVGGVLLAFTSYVSSFPEFMMTYRFAISNKKNALLAMLFGSNVIDLAFAGFRAIWRGEVMSVYTTGRYPQLLPVYLWTLPVMAAMALFALWTKRIRYGHAYPLVVFYLIYIISGLILL
jgi:Ca2+/Na+ antiporter